MTMNSDIPNQGPDGIPAFAIVGLGFNVPTVGQSVTITVGPAADGSPTSTAWMFAPMTVQFNLNGTAYGVLTVTATPTNATVTLRNDGLATAGTPVPVGAGIVSGGPQGPTGATGATGAAGVSSFTTLGTGGLTMPAPGSTVTVNVGSSSWTAVGNFIAVSDGTKVAVLQVTALPSGQMTLLNPIGMNINPLANATFAAGSAVTQSAPQVGPISESQVGTTKVGNAAFDVAQILGGQTLIIPVPLPALALSEVVDIAASISFWSTTTSDFSRVKQVMAVRNNGGTYQDPLGLTTAIDVTSPAQALYSGASVAPTVVSMKVQGAGLVVSVTAPVGITIQARGVIGYERGGTVTAAGPGPVITSVTAASGGAGGGTSLHILGSGFTGVSPAQPPGSVTLASVVPSFTTVSDGEVDCVAGPNPSGAATGPIIVTHPLNGPSNTNFTWTYVDDPLVILPGMRFFGRGESAVQSSNVVSSWADLTTFANNFTANGAPGFTAADATINNKSTIQFTVNDFFRLASMVLPAADQSLFMWAVCKVTDASTREIFNYDTGGGEILYLAGLPDTEGLAKASATWGSTQTGAWVLIWGVSDSSAAGSTPNQVDVNNGTAVSGASSVGTVRAASAQASIGRRTSAFNDRNFLGSMAAVGVVPYTAGSPISTAQKNRLRAWVTTFYGF